MVQESHQLAGSDLPARRAPCASLCRQQMPFSLSSCASAPAAPDPIASTQRIRSFANKIKLMPEVLPAGGEIRHRLRCSTVAPAEKDMRHRVLLLNDAP